ncbi:hypothetical protein [Chitinophaga alhagiae]|uniref:hypothetical protein n=1 Tax=Chitinophaga alhagiae TaxID=2203219 RepID=UPI0013001C29|nr:hypothetical protein [Chitinophaga alhagiae]
MKMMALLLWIVVPHLNGSLTAPQRQGGTPWEQGFVGYFEGSEPFWNMKISNDTLVLHCINTIEKDTFYFSGKQAHTNTWAFRGKHVFGVIRKSSGTCQLDITEEENPTHEIYFSYKNVTYMGCGKLLFNTSVKRK